MSNICVCVEGQLRGAKRCGPTIKKHVVDHLGADLHFCLQNYERHEEENLNHYGSFKEKLVYDNPQPDFTNIFNDLCKRFGYKENDWLQNFKLNDCNFTLGFKKPGTCIRRMYNRYKIYQMFRRSNYEWFIILRSDLFFVDDFFEISSFNKDKLSVYRSGGHEGVNNNIIIFHKNNFDKILTYIKNFLNLSFYNFINNDSNLKNLYINEEKFFMYNMLLNKVEIDKIKNVWYISADSENEFTTWQSIKRSSNGDLLKYFYDYNDAMVYLRDKK